MSSVEWVEVRGKDVDVAVAAAVEELGLDGPDSADIEVLQQPERGFLGMGGKDAIVRVKPKQKPGRRRRRGGRGRGNGRRDGRGGAGKGTRSGGDGGKRQRQQQGSRREEKGRSEGESRRKERPQRDEKPQQRARTPRQSRPRSEQPAKKEHKVEVEADRTEQAEMVRDFLRGLLDAFGLEGEVTCTVEEEIILADVSGEQTEALVGNKGAILQSILELSRTIVQRKSQSGARIRLDIAGYTARRREALRIYTGRLVEKVLAEGGEIMLEPMNPADRKVVHDSAAELGGVRTFSEGEEPRRSVVISRDDT